MPDTHVIVRIDTNHLHDLYLLECSCGRSMELPAERITDGASFAAMHDKIMKELHSGEDSP